jgi:hypothetical protein
MLQALLIVLGVYVAACYVYGMYLALRLFTGRRLRQTAMGTANRRLVRPLSPSASAPVGPAEQAAAQEVERAKAAA